MRIALALTLLGLASCSIPGILPEGRDARVTHQEIDASAADVHERALQLLTRSSYGIVSSTASQFIRAEKPIEDNRINVIEVRTAAAGSGTRLELHGWTDAVTALGRRHTPQFDARVGTDVDNLSRQLSCPSAGWPRCP